MNDISVLIGGKAGDGINSAGLTIAHLFNHLGYRVYMYFDYPSLIKGGHNFAIVRASDNKIGAHRETVDFLLALNNDTITSHTGYDETGHRDHIRCSECYKRYGHSRSCQRDPHR